MTALYAPVWDTSVPPGGFVCNVCAMPVETEPCDDHAPKRSVVGLDLSLTATGVADLSAPRHTSRIRPGDLRGTERLRYIYAAVGDQIDGAELVVVEGPSYGSMSGAGHHEAAGLWWLIRYELDLYKLPVAVVPPSVLKKYATGRGNATKADMRVALLQRTGIDLRDDNEVDAWWLAAAGHHHLGELLVELPAAQRAALGSVAWPESS
ncbi:hypothetical protein Skr01_36610 [Sphaerisporangium krabiense]|uniref:Holliday junction resolvasome RuvABC endonuclease subunit n=1 Tax=Sphaerisporangium krabiense TaxID=763782 RepID=A0A7W8Z3B2_9ACTN|nr:hypothetical protein [Sphaerisporangium krabiense]MBB5626656.1 Holliday junction resolvasome RuvABC endonuclease subunit [Sphaerisporangium krabiense]GII63576.1 hypothetical protein Skr01_36610 [Sphaerisporangium krabiense]